MGVIDKFLDNYRREIDFYEESARICAQICENELKSVGIRAIVTHRAKRVDRLKDKLSQRNAVKNYRRIEDIYDDIVDLAGVRIALYFPADRVEVEKLIESKFKINHIKRFPENSRNGVEQRFLGYCANHYRVNLKTDNLPTEKERYCQALIEIQVASVLMHAWAEVDHDLAYKPLSGKLSEDEQAILEELNGLVSVGELALERLQKAVKVRVSEKDVTFNNHYELAAFLYDSIKPLFKDSKQEPVMGSADVLFRFLQLAELNRPEHLNGYLISIDLNTEKRPIVDQIVDYILFENFGLYSKYSQAREEIGGRNPYSNSKRHGKEEALGYFVSQWVKLEQLIRSLAQFDQRTPVPNIRFLVQKLQLEDNIAFEIDWLRRLRNQLIHGIDFPPEEHLLKAGKSIDEIIDMLKFRFEKTSDDEISA